MHIVLHLSKHKLMREGNDVDFNYTAYWEQAMETALKSQRSEAMPSPSPCPKVFVYDLPSKLKDSTEKERGFGRKIILRGKDKLFQGLLHNTNQYSFPSILEQRLKQSRLCRTNNPQEADLFYVPVLTAPKGGDEWKAACSKITGQDIRDALPYLNETNACRHFFAFGKGHYVSYYCRGWFSEPIDELKPFLRLAYSHRSFDKHINGTPFLCKRRQYPVDPIQICFLCHIPAACTLASPKRTCRNSRILQDEIRS